MMKSGDLDVMLNIVFTDERDESLELTDPYMEFATSVYSGNEDQPVSTVEDLYGRTLAVPEGWYFEEYFREFEDIDLLMVEDTTEAIIAVSQGAGTLQKLLWVLEKWL